MPPVKLVWYDGGMRPPRPAELEDGRMMGASGRLLIGDKGKILDSRIIPEKKMKEYQLPPQDHPAFHRASQGVDCGLQGRGPPAGSNFDWAGPLAEAVLLGNVALRLELRKKLTRQKLPLGRPESQNHQRPRSKRLPPQRIPQRMGCSNPHFQVATVVPDWCDPVDCRKCERGGNELPRVTACGHRTPVPIIRCELSGWRQVPGCTGQDLGSFGRCIRGSAARSPDCEIPSLHDTQSCLSNAASIRAITTTRGICSRPAKSIPPSSNI